MSSLAVGPITMDDFVKEFGNVFWGKLTWLKRQDDVPKDGENSQAYNFISNILSPYKQRADGKERPIKDKTPTNLPIDMKKYIGMTKQAAVRSIYAEKGWPDYTPRIKKSEQSANAPTPSRLKAEVYNEDEKIMELTEKIDTLELQEVEAFKNRNTSQAKALSQQRIKLKQQKQKRISVLTSHSLKKEKKNIIKEMDKLVVEYPTATDERRQEMNEEMDQGNARLAEIKKELNRMEESEMKKKKKKLSAQQDEPEYEEFINEELDEFLRTKNSTNNFSVSIAIDKKGNLYCDYDSVNNTMGKKFGTYNRATGKWKLYKSYLKILGTNPEKTQAELIKSLMEQDDDEEDTNCNINEPNNIGEMCEVTDIRNTKNFLVPEFEVENKSGKKISSVDILSTEITDNFLIKLNVELNEATQNNDDEKKGSEE